MACSSARPPRSTTTPTALPAALGRRACRSSTTHLNDPLHQQGVPDGTPGPEPSGDAADRHARRYRRHPEGDGRTGPAAGGENSGRVVLARRAQGEYAGGISPRRRRAVRGDRPPADAEILADRIRLARRRARGRAAVRVPVPHGARPLADRQAPPRRLLARGRLSHLRTRQRAARPDRHRGARGAADRRRLLRRRYQGGRPRLHRHGGQRQSEPRARHRGPGRQGRDLDAGAQVVHRAVRAVAARAGMAVARLKRIALAAAAASLLYAPAAAQQKLDKVSFGTNWLAEAEHGGHYQALVDGTYRRYGLDVTIVPGGPNVNNRLLLPVGKLDFFMSANTLQSFDAVARNIPTLAVAAMFQKDP